jgi:hypothetical protein
MTGRDRAIAGKQRIVRLTVVCLSLVLVLPGCTDFRRALGMDRVGPDEFAVESRAPLTIPPDFDLRPPQPGAQRPQEVTAAERARKVIDTAGPGEPGKQAAPALRPAAGGLPGSLPQADAPQQSGEQILANKLLGAGDTAAGATVDKRETSPLKGVY